MSVSAAMRDKLHRAYWEFFETAERKRRWSVFDDIPWDEIDEHQDDPAKALLVETFCAEELFLPDYLKDGMELTRPVFGFAWFQINWGYEESRHGLVLREYLTRSGLRSLEEFEAYSASLSSLSWSLPFATRREMACYGAIQEAATFLAYKTQKDRAAAAGDRVLEAVFAHLSRDEAAHAGFYRTVVEFELEEDRAGTIADLRSVLADFRMPGDGLIPDYLQRLRDGAGGISTRAFFQHAVLSTLRTLGTSRHELRLARGGDDLAVPRLSQTPLARDGAAAPAKP